MNHTSHVHSDWKVIKLNMVWRGKASKMLWTHLTTLMTHTVLYKSTYHAGPHSTFCHSFNVKANVFLRAWSRSWPKERASFVYNFLAIWLVYCPKWVFLIGYYIKKQLPQEFLSERSDRKVEHLFTKIRLQLLSYCKNSSRIKIILMQNIHIGVSKGAAMEEAIWKDQSTRVWKKESIRWHSDASSEAWTLLYNGKLANQIAKLVAIVVKKHC